MEHHNEASPGQADIPPEQLKAALVEQGATPEQIEEVRRGMKDYRSMPGYDSDLERLIFDECTTEPKLALYHGWMMLVWNFEKQDSDENEDPDDPEELACEPGGCVHCGAAFRMPRRGVMRKVRTLS